MTLDDRSLREHLDRRAVAGVTDVEHIAEVVMTRVAATASGPWWRRIGVRGPSLGVAAAGIAVLILALAVLPPSIWNGPGTSPTPSAERAAGYPATRALTAEELDAVLGSDPSARAGTVVIADVTLEVLRVVCLGTACPRYLIDLGDREIYVFDSDPPDPIVGSPYAFRVTDHPGGRLELLGSVRPGPDGLAWTLPQLTAALVDLKGPGARPVPYLYLVDAWRAVSTTQYRCRAGFSGVFGCGSGVAWLVADEATVSSNSAPPGSLRIPNAAGDSPGAGDPQHGYWLVDPFVAQEDCFLCPPAGAADLLGRVLTLDELGVTLPAPRPSATAGAPTPTPIDPQTAAVEIGFSTGSMALDGFETSDVTVSITFPAGLRPDPGADPSLAPIVVLERGAGDTGDPTDPHIPQLVRAMAPTPDAGQWTATYRLTSGDRGIWRVGGVVAYDIEGHELVIDPAISDTSPTLEVLGTHVPDLTVLLDPYPVEVGRALEVSGRVTDQDSGDPIGDVIVTVGSGAACAPGGIGTTVRTNENGDYAFMIPEADGTTVCAWISGEPGVYPSFDVDVPIALYAAVFAEPTN